MGENRRPRRMFGCSLDISKRQRAEADSARHFRALQIVSKSNLALVQAVDEVAYLEEVCRIAVEEGGYRMAWIGCAERDEQKTVRPVAQAGIEDGYLDTVAVRWADCERGRGPMGTAIRTQQPSVIRDVQKNYAFAPWREAAIRRGYHSVVGLPLLCGKDTYGGLTVYSADVDAFNDGELTILKELAQNVGFGMSVVRSRLERELTTKALQASERRLAEAQRIAHVGNWEYDVKKDHITWSDEACRIFGRHSETPIATSAEFQELIHPDDRAASAQAICNAIESCSTYDHEHRVIRPDGGVRYIHCRGEVTRDTAGQPDHVVGTVQDVTERRQAEEALRRSTEIQRRAMEIALVSGFVYEVPSETFLLSEQAAVMYGLQSSMTMEDAWKLVHPDDLPHVQAAWRASLAGVLYNAEYRAVVQGQTRWINARAKPETDGEGRVIRIIGVLQDVTDRRLLEDQLRQAQKMKAVGQLAAGVAHDFNNLMTVIIGYCYMLLRRLKEDDPLRKPVVESYKAADQAAALTRQLLAFSRQQVLEPKVLHLGTIVADAEEMLKVIVGDDIRLEISSDSAAGLVRVDPTQVQQVIINLAANARDAMPEGGSLSITTLRAAAAGQHSRPPIGMQLGNYSLLTITDTGKGMDKATLAQLFEPFFTTKEPGRGTGLGMAVVYGIVNQSRGFINVSSEVGKGTTFSIFFPLVEECESTSIATLRPGTSTAIPKGRGTVLVVEDDESVRTLARSVLRSSGYTVLEAANGRDAVELVQSHSGFIDLVVADVVMPYLGGRPLADRLAELKRGLKVLFISGHVDATLEKYGVREADFPFLEKPFTPVALAQKVRELLDTARKANSPTFRGLGE